MDEFYRQRLDLVLPCSSEDDDRITHNNMASATPNTTTTTTTCDDNHGDFRSGGSLNDLIRFEDAHKMGSKSIAGSDMSDLIKTQISSHPLYPQLVSAYIQCQKVGAPPEIVSLLEEIGKDHNHRRISMTCAQIGTNPELDEFMESYCEILHKYKEELSKPFDEAAMFLNDIESQLNNLCKDANTSTTSLGSGNCHSVSDEVAGSSDEELSCGDAEARAGQDSLHGPSDDKNLKEVLLRKYSGYLSSLRKEFLKKRKNGKLPKDARMVLLDWWNSHYRWPYPTEEEKSMLSEVTGLDQKQINNWFINQRKRHWKPSEDMRFALMDGVSGSIGGPSYFDSGGAGHNF